MKINYNNKKFRPILNAENGETSSETIFLYWQNDDILTDLENFVKYPKEDDKTTTIFWVLTVLTEINLYSAEKLGQFLVF